MKKRNITEFQILSEIIRKQPHIKQKEISDVLGITVQGVSEHIRNLLKKGLITSRGRGEYVLTTEGTKTLKTWISDFREYLENVNHNLYRYKDVWPAIANEDLSKGEKVYLYMNKGHLYASKYNKSSSIAYTIEDASAMEDVGVEKIEGIINIKKGKVIILKIPPKVRGGSKNVNYEIINKTLSENKEYIIATMGTVSYVVSKKLNLKNTIEFAVLEGTINACEKGCNVILLITGKMAEKAVKLFDNNKISYSVIDCELPNVGDIKIKE